MQFTLWPNQQSNTGGHTTISWLGFLGFVDEPKVVSSIEILEGWSPAKFKSNTRSTANVEAVSAIVLDDDSTGLPLERVAEIWRDFAGVVHSSRRHTREAPRWRIVLRCSRDMTAAEHARVWSHVRDLAAARGQTLDEQTKDPSRLWFCPVRVTADGPYEWLELTGASLDVDAILATTPAEVAPAVPAPTPRIEAPAANRLKAVAAMLGAAWPPHGKRHEAKLALAGALRNEGWSKDEAREFLQELYDIVGSEGDTDTEALNSTYSKPEGSALTGWTRLKAHVDPVVVDAARSALGRDAEGLEMMTRRLAEVSAARGEVETTNKPENEDGIVDWDIEDPPVEWTVAGIVQSATVNLAFGNPNSLKTWAMYLMAAAVAKGEAWLGRAARQGLVVILDYESSVRQARRRMRLLRRFGLTKFVRYFNPREMLHDLKLWERLAQLKPALIIIDSLSRGMLGRNENDAKEIAIPLDFAKRLARECNTSTIFIHHKNKSGAEGFESARGSGAIAAAAEGWFEFLDFEKRDGGVQRVRLHCARLKESVPFDDILLELSDAKGLVEVKEDIEALEHDELTVDGVKPKLLLLVAAHPEIRECELLRKAGLRSRIAKKIGLEALNESTGTKLTRRRVNGGHVYSPKKSADEQRGAVLAAIDSGVKGQSDILRSTGADEELLHAMGRERIIYRSGGFWLRVTMPTAD